MGTDGLGRCFFHDRCLRCFRRVLGQRDGRRQGSVFRHQTRRQGKQRQSSGELQHYTLLQYLPEISIKYNKNNDYYIVPEIFVRNAIALFFHYDDC